MYNSDRIMPHSEEYIMDPQSERLVLLAYNVGLLQAVEQECNNLLSENKQLKEEIRTTRLVSNNTESMYVRKREALEEANKEIEKLKKKLNKNKKVSKK